jgi:hypothetical protein
MDCVDTTFYGSGLIELPRLPIAAGDGLYLKTDESYWIPRSILDAHPEPFSIEELRGMVDSG